VTRWTPAFALDERDARAPLFVRIARSVADDVRRGRLRPGAALPGQRALAASLDVDRDTVVAAYRELAAQGWIVVRPSKGAFVADAFPEHAPARAARRGAPPERPGFAFEQPDASARDVVPQGGFDLAGCAPDLREFPATELARALRRQLRRRGKTLLAYGDPRGHAGLRAALATMLSTRRGLAVSADDVIVVRGSQMGLDLAARALLRPGDAVAVEALGYRPAWAALEAAGARLVPFAVDRDGLDVDALESALATRRIRAVYLTPHHQYPTTVTLSPARRIALLDAARRHGLAVIEDDYDHEFHYDGRPVQPLAAADAGGHVVYVGTLSKTLAPALRMGYVVAARRVIDGLADIRMRVDRQGDAAMEAAVADLMDEGEVQRHVWRTQRLYRARRDAFAEILAKRLRGVIEFRVPSGGTAVWARVAEGIDVEAWARRALERGVVLRTGRNFTPDSRSIPYLRMNFSAYEASRLDEAARRLVAALPTKKR